MSSEQPPWTQASVVSSAESEREPVTLDNVNKPGVAVSVWTHQFPLLGAWAVSSLCSPFLSVVWRTAAEEGEIKVILFLWISLFYWFPKAWESNCSSLLGPNSNPNEASFLLVSLLTFVSLFTAVSSWQLWSVPWPCSAAAEVAKSYWEVCW